MMRPQQIMRVFAPLVALGATVAGASSGGSATTTAPTVVPTIGHPTTSTSDSWTFEPTAMPTASPTTAPTTDFESPWMTWEFEGNEVKMKETSNWGAVVYAPDPEGEEDVTWYFDKTEERLSQLRVGMELYDVIYNNGDITDLALASSDVHRALQIGSDVKPDSVGCETCGGVVTLVCDMDFLACGLLSGLIIEFSGGVAAPGAQWFMAVCGATLVFCGSENEMIQYTDICRNSFCCDRHRCGFPPLEGGQSCYDDDSKCCNDSSIIDANACCEEDVAEQCCGLERCGDIPGSNDPYCYESGAEKCCYPNGVVSPNECCPHEVPCGDGCFDPLTKQCCDDDSVMDQDLCCDGFVGNNGAVNCCADTSIVGLAECCTGEEPCEDGCFDPQTKQCCPGGIILGTDECCAGFVGYNGDVNCCGDGSIVEWDECCFGEEKCQGTCYDPTTRECCEEGPLVEGCPRVCDDGSTVLQSNGECCPNEVQCLYGSSCYIPDKSICCEDDTVVDIDATCPPDTPPTPAPTTPAPQPIQNVVPKRGGSVDGDPHIRLYDGGSGYDCHGQGEFVITKAATTDSEVQGRFQQWSQNPNPAVTVTTSVAMREGSSSVVQASPSASGGLEVLVDGEPYDEVAGVVTGVALEVTSAKVEMRFPSGLDVFVFVTTNGILRVNVYAPLDLATTGLLGNNNGELYDDWKTADGEIVEFAVPGRPTTVVEGTNYCTTNWCTTHQTSIFAYADGEDHGTFDLCDAVYSPPVLPDVVPASTTELCGDNANCIFDALLAGEDVGQATLEGEEADRLYQEAIGGLCASNSFSSTGMPPCTACPAGEVSGTGATSCILQQEPVGGLSTPDNIPENIAAAMLADAAGGFAGPGSLTRSPAGTIELTEADLGSVSLSGTFVRDDSAELPLSASVFFYVENAEHPDDFFRGHEDLATFTGNFSKVVTDIPVGSSRLFLSFVVEDPAEALNGAEAAAGSVFTFDVPNMGCTPSLTITLEVGTARASLFVTEPGGKSVNGFVDNGYGDVGFFQNVERFAVQNYIIYTGLDPGIDLVLGGYEASLVVLSNPMPSPMFLTARVFGEVVWVEEIVEDSASRFTVSLTDYDPSCGGNP